MINVRDEKLCQYLLSFGFLSSEQIKKLLFKDVNKRTMLRRLRTLKNKKVLERFESSKGGMVLWTLNPKQVSKMGSDFVMKNINRSTLAHDLCVNDLRIQFELKGIGSAWRSSHYLRFKASNGKRPLDRLPETIPDWLVTLNGKVFAIEVELNFKGIKRMERVLSLYAEKKSIQHLWYFVPSVEMREKLLRLAQRYALMRGKSWVKVSLLSEIDRAVEVLTAMPTV